MSQEVFRSMTEALAHDEYVALAIIVEVNGSSPAVLGTKMVVWPDGHFVGTVGGGTLEKEIIADAVKALQEGHPRMEHYILREEGPEAVGMLCGGDVRVYIDVQKPAPTLLIVGAGHIGQPLAQMGMAAAFRVQVIDVGPEAGALDVLAEVPITQDTYVAVMTAEANADEDALRRVIEKPAAYIGMIGSRRKSRTILDRLRQEGIPEETLARVHAPIGLDLGGCTPGEIAVSVLAEIIAVRNGGDGRPLSAKMREEEQEKEKKEGEKREVRLNLMPNGEVRPEG